MATDQPLAGRQTLDAAQITETIERLSRRIEIRFPGAGLLNVCRHLFDVARHTAETAAWIDRPLIPLRIAIGLLLLLITAGFLVTVNTIRTPADPLTLAELVQVIESGVNDLLF